MGFFLHPYLENEQVSHYLSTDQSGVGYIRPLIHIHRDPEPTGLVPAILVILVTMPPDD